jgi:uncharacterized protein (TIRG00374 family)
MKPESAKRSRLKDWLSLVLKWSVSLLLAYILVTRTDCQAMLVRLAKCQFDPALLAVGFVFCGLSVFLTLVRWNSLLAAFGVDVHKSSVMRIGLFSYALNLLALGGLGGDVGRAILITKRSPDQRQEAILSVAADRMIGLYAMIFIAFVMVVYGNLLNAADQRIRFIAGVTVFGTTTMPVGLFAATRMLQAIQANGRIAGFRLVKKIREMCSACQGQGGPMGKAFVTSLVLRVSTAVGIYFFGLALVADAPGLKIHLLAVSVALLTGCLPLPLNGLGAFESVLELVFQSVPGSTCPPGYGIAVALVYRVFLVAVGLLGGLLFALDGRLPGSRWARPAVAD